MRCQRMETRQNKSEAEKRDVFVPKVQVQTAAKPHSAQENLFSLKKLFRRARKQNTVSS